MQTNNFYINPITVSILVFTRTGNEHTKESVIQMIASENKYHILWFLCISAAIYEYAHVCAEGIFLELSPM